MPSRAPGALRRPRAIDKVEGRCPTHAYAIIPLLVILVVYAPPELRPLLDDEFICEIQHVDSVSIYYVL